MEKLFFYIGIRPSSAGRSDLETKDHCPLPIQNVVSMRQKRLQYTIVVDITTLKGLRNEMGEDASQNWEIGPVKEKLEILFNLESTTIPMLVHRGICSA
ncbi:unnamed protein product [Sympodiomycopsis kandeliae]